MGRYYSETDNDMFEGKFWFAVQSSSALSEIGIPEDEPSRITYSLCKDDESVLMEYILMVESKIEGLKGLITTLESTLESTVEEFEEFEEFYEFANSIQDESKLKLLANYEMAQKCYLSLQEVDYIVVDCEL